MIWNKPNICTSRNKEYEQLAKFVSTTQLLAGYLCAKGYPGMLYTHAVAVKPDDYRMQKQGKLLCICHEAHMGIELSGCLV